MKYVFVDMDGTIAEWGYPDGRYSGEMKERDYLDKKPLSIVIEEIANRYSNEEHCLIVCSAIPCSNAIFEKNIWLDMFFNVPYENRIFIGKDEDKFETIKYYIESVQGKDLKENAIIIDDKKEVLIKAKKAGVECYHPTQIISACEERRFRIEQEKKAAQEENKDEVVTPQPEVMEGQMEISDVEFEEV